MERLRDPHVCFTVETSIQARSKPEPWKCTLVPRGGEDTLVCPLFDSKRLTWRGRTGKGETKGVSGPEVSHLRPAVAMPHPLTCGHTQMALSVFSSHPKPRVGEDRHLH